MRYLAYHWWPNAVRLFFRQGHLSMWVVAQLSVRFLQLHVCGCLARLVGTVRHMCCNPLSPELLSRRIKRPISSERAAPSGVMIPLAARVLPTHPDPAKSQHGVWRSCRSSVARLRRRIPRPTASRQHSGCTGPCIKQTSQEVLGEMRTPTASQLRDVCAHTGRSKGLMYCK